MPVLNYADALALGGPDVDAAHLDGYRVWPMPPPYLEPPMGQVTTPDLPIDTVDSDIRLRVKLRANSLPPASPGGAMLAMQRAVGAANLTWDASVLTAGSVRWRWSTNGSSFAWAPITHLNGTVIAGQDQFFGMRMERQTGTAQRFYGEVSNDGAVWTDNGTTVDVATLVPFDSTAPIYVGGVPSGYIPFPGRIYWVQYDAIHLARLMLPGYGGCILTGPSLWGTGGTTQGVEILVRASSNWSAPSADLQGFVYLGSRLGVRRTTSQTVQFYLYGADGASTTSTANQPAGWVDGQTVWMRAAHDGTTITFQWAPDSISIPTTWTDLRTPMAAVSPGLRAATNPLVIGSDTPTGTSRLLIGRLARVIIRDTIGGPHVFDVSENDAGTMPPTATSFTSRSGHALTLPNIAGASAPYLDSANYATTPDAPELRILGDFRVTAKVRDDSAEQAMSRMIADRSTGGYAWRLATYGDKLMVVGWPTGATSPQISAYPATRTEVGLTPPGTDPVYLGAEMIGVDPSSTALTLTATAMTSPDGTTWNRRSPYGPLRADSFSFAATGTLRVNYGWGGRIYWAQVESINRRTFGFPGIAGQYLSVPDSASLDITDDIEIVARVEPTTWRPTGTVTMIGKWSTASVQRSFGLGLAAAGNLLFYMSSTGGDYFQSLSSAVIPSGSTSLWVKATRVRSTGAVSFYTAPDGPVEPTAWTQLGTALTLTAGTGMFAGTAPVEIGSIVLGTTQNFPGKIHRVILRTGVAGQSVLDVNSRNLPGVAPGATSFTSSDTVNRYLAFPPTTPAGNHVQIPIAQPVGDQEFVFRLSQTDWETAPLTSTTPMWFQTPGACLQLSRAYWGARAMMLQWWGTGVGTAVASSGDLQWSYPAGLAPKDGMLWVRIRIDVDNGAGGHTVIPEYALDAPNEPTSWAAWGPPTTKVGTITAFAPATGMRIGGGGGVSLDGRCRRFIYRQGFAGTVRVDFDAEVNLNGIDPLAASFAVTTGGTATVSRAGSPQIELVTGRLPVTVVQTVATRPASIPSLGNVSLPDPGSVPAKFTLVSWFRMPPMGNFNVVSSTSYQLAFTATNLYVRIYSGGGFQGGAVANVTQLTAAGVVPGANVWLAGSVDCDAAGQVVYKAYVSTDGLTWTQLGGTVSLALVPTVVSSAVTIGNPSGSVWQGGAIYSTELRTGLDPAAGTIGWRFDAAEYPGTGTSYVDPRGQTWTLSSAGVIVPKLDPVVQALPDATVWRFDAADVPAATGAVTYTDPRGRSWSLVAPIVPAGAAPIVQPQPDQTLWRFDANDWPPGATAVNELGRTWTASAPGAVQHPASIPDQEVIDVG